MPNSQNENAVRRVFDYMSQPNRNQPGLDQILDSSWTISGGIIAPSGRGPEAARELHDFFWTAFSDFKMTPERMISDGDWVAVHYSIQGRHTGEFMGAHGTGKSFKVHVMAMWRYQNGKQVEGWILPDRLDWLQQLGIVQAPAQQQRKAA